MCRVLFLFLPNTNPRSVALPQAKHSILDYKTVSYPNGKLTLAPYLDSFPFPYYVVLRNIQTLPDILADALRQWFELITQSLADA